MTNAIFLHNQYSRSARQLADGLNLIKLYRRDAAVPNRILNAQEHIVRFSPFDTTINWGCCDTRELIINDGGIHNRVLNPTYLLKNVINKQAFFREMRNNFNRNNQVYSTESTREAADLLTDGNVLIARELLNSSGGRGIKILTSPDDLDNTDAVLFTIFEDNKFEFRVHVMAGHEIYVQRKRKNNDTEVVDFPIKNHSNGYFFSPNLGVRVETRNRLCELAVSAVRLFNLDFGAVDLIIVGGTPKVLEINTAPGLEGTTLETYITAFRDNFGIV